MIRLRKAPCMACPFVPVPWWRTIVFRPLAQERKGEYLLRVFCADIEDVYPSKEEAKKALAEHFIKEAVAKQTSRSRSGKVTKREALTRLKKLLKRHHCPIPKDLAERLGL